MCVCVYACVYCLRLVPFGGGGGGKAAFLVSKIARPSTDQYYLAVQSFNRLEPVK